MKNLAIIISLIISQFSFAQIDTVTLKSTISDVTVFFSGAEITRTAKTNLPKGKHLILFDKLPLEINPQSIQVNGNSDFEIRSVKHQTNYRDQGKKSAAVEAIYKKIETQKVEMKSVGNEIAVQELEERLLLENSDISNKERNISIEQLSSTATFYNKRVNSIKRKRLDLTVQLKDMQDQLEDHYKTLNKLVVDNRRTYSQVLVIVDCKKYTNKDLKLKYLVSSAGWEPMYDFRVKDISSPLKIVYNANIYQSSGENWEKVNVILSSGNPTESGEIPQLESFYLGRQQQVKRTVNMGGVAAITGRVFEASNGEAVPFANVVIYKANKQIAVTSTDFDGLYTIKPLPVGQFTIKVSYVGFNPISSSLNLQQNKLLLKDFAISPGVDIAEVAIKYKKPLFKRDQSSASNTTTRTEIKQMAVRSVADISKRAGGGVTFIDGVNVTKKKSEMNLISNSLKKGVAQTEYRIDVPYTILSDGEDYNLKIKEVTLKTNYKYFAIPKLDPDAFLTATLTDWNELNLLSGRTSIFYEGTFTSESYLDTEKAEDTLTISLGRDKDIYIERILDKNLYSKKTSLKNVKESVAWKIVIKNNKGAPINLVVEDQYPLSDRENVKTELESWSGAKIEKETGKITWELDLEPSQKKELLFKYNAQYPKYYYVPQ